MKLAILGSPDRKEKDLPLLNEANKIFDSSLYIPVDGINLKVGEDTSALFKRVNLSEYDVILPIPTYRNKEFYYTCLRILEKNVYTPIPSDKFFMMWNKPLMLRLFANNGIDVRKTFVVACNVAANTIINQLKLPVIITPPSRKKVLVTNENTLKNVLDLFRPGHTLIVEKPIKPESMIWVFVIGDEIIASYEKGDKGRRPVIIDKDLERLALKIREIISSDYCAINFIRTKSTVIVNEVTLSPDFSLYQVITGKNVSRSLLSYLRTKAKKEGRSLLDRFIDSFVDAIRWIENEISNIRTIGKRI